jgi:hypothetical protein
MARSDRALENDRRRSRHVSIRVPVALFQRLETLAVERNESVSQAARRLISHGLEPGGRNTIDEAIATLMSVRDHYPPRKRSTGATGHESGAVRQSAPKRIEILNAKTDLQRLIADVSRGDEFVITHAGAPRARLVAVDDRSSPHPPDSE